MRISGNYNLTSRCSLFPRGCKQGKRANTCQRAEVLNWSMRRQTRDAHDLRRCRHHSSCSPVKWRRKNRTKSSPPGAAYMLAIDLCRIRAIGCGSDIADTSSSRRPITCSPSKNERNFSNWRPCYLRLAFDNQNGSAALVMWRWTSAQGQNLARPLKQGQNAAGKAATHRRLTLLLVPLSQPHPWAAAVLVDELNPGGF